MAQQVADVVIHASESQEDLTDDNLDVSVDLIDDGLYLGNLACARDYSMLHRLGISHILTIDLVPLPLTVLDHKEFIFKFVKLADVPKEDMITRLPDMLTFIKESIAKKGIVLVHCYFGVSRSAAVVIAFIMDKYGLCYDEAFALVKAKRRFIGPNIGFVAQLKLFGHMGCTIDKEDPRFKQFRLKMAGQKLKQVKILPQSFHDLIKADPALASERPAPGVLRCRTCRRVLAATRHLLPHLPRPARLARARRVQRPQPNTSSELTSAENGEILIEKLKNLACQGRGVESEGHSSDEKEVLDGYNEQNLVDSSVLRGWSADACAAMWFVEPLAWMRAAGAAAGKLHCPKCDNKVGSFNWLMGCKCPCGQKVAPAFYLVPSKVERSNIVQNVQVTV